MNFLAHLYLSGEDPDLKVGNFIGDFVKGKKHENYPHAIARGILLHRQIDSFTDQHAQVKQSIQRLRPKYGLYAGVLVDMFYDHFLACRWSDWHSQPLEKFIEESYALLREVSPQMPATVQRFLPYMIEENWLLRYTHFKGLERSLRGLDSRTRYRAGFTGATKDLQADYEAFAEDFQRFFPDLIAFAQAYRERP